MLMESKGAADHFGVTKDTGMDDSQYSGMEGV